MPIYAYKCESCGHNKDVLQKMSDAPLTDCPQCGAPAFKKQLTAAGFQLKGSGWYVTDFRGGAGATAVPPVAGGDTAAPASADGKSSEKAAPAATTAPASSATPATASAAPSVTSTPKAS
ncbi:MAG TPA: FmdB family zinc ribbon protein [Polaromonas sp.]|uniref:FmdB family zinc ribbon protein n=1 Tax=Polaromonas sp. TaxID=1869339 RepID=UPI002D2D62D3|nr:FmdB family zinc ribbon protein [Polaromonas sp.]HYW56908.1 FmdB family zinc ribbon protein [Polaromonas sp.]